MKRLSGAFAVLTVILTACKGTVVIESDRLASATPTTSPTPTATPRTSPTPTATPTTSSTPSMNTPPVATAGNPSRILAPTSTTVLDGSASHDAEGPLTYSWTQTSGDSSAVLASPTSSITGVSQLKPGFYTFRLTVTDTNGVSRYDETYITMLEKRAWTVDGIEREAIVHVPTGGTGSVPVIFAFHGHGGTDLGFADKAFEASWPEALVIYPQGLKTKSPGDPECKSSGWQHAVGETNCDNGKKDQDLNFFDAMLVSFKAQYSIDKSRIFAHGWSNGGEFVYDVLWTARGNLFAALSPAASILNTSSGKTPLPLIHVAGTQDPSVAYKKQSQSVQTVRSLNGCDATGVDWDAAGKGLSATEYCSSTSNHVVMISYDGGHGYPFSVPPQIVKFFKEVTAN